MKNTWIVLTLLLSSIWPKKLQLWFPKPKACFDFLMYCPFFEEEKKQGKSQKWWYFLRRNHFYWWDKFPVLLFITLTPQYSGIVLCRVNIHVQMHHSDNGTCSNIIGCMKQYDLKLCSPTNLEELNIEKEQTFWSIFNSIPLHSIWEIVVQLWAFQATNLILWWDQTGPVAPSLSGSKIQILEF